MPVLVRLLIATCALLLSSTVTLAAPPPCQGRDLWTGAAPVDIPVDRAKVEAMAAIVVNARAVLWRLQAPAGGPVSYLFGTMHLTDPRVTDLSPNLTRALDAVEVVAFENRGGIDKSQAAATLGRVGAALFMADGGNYGQLLDASGLDRLHAALDRRGMPLLVVYGWKPEVLVFSALAYPPCELARTTAGESILDSKILAEAQMRGRDTADLETLEEQFAALSDVPMAAQLDHLQATVRMDPYAEDLQQTALDFYLARRIDLLWAFYNVVGAALSRDPRDIDAMWATMLDRRNAAMFANALNLARARPTFIAVGAAHLIGDKGFVQRFKGAGFRVDPIE